MGETDVLATALVGIVIFGSLLFGRIDSNWRRLYHPWLVISAVMAAYSLTPVLAGDTSDGDRGLLVGFLRLMVVASASLLVGMALGHGIPQRHCEFAAPATAVPRSTRRGPPPWMLIVATAAWLVTVDRFDGGLVRVVTQGYFTGEEIAPAEVIWLAFGVFTLMGLVSASLLLFGVSWQLTAVSTLFVIVNLLGGHRNFVTMFVGALAAVSAIRTRRLRYSLVGPGSVLAFIGMMLIGVIRHSGLQGLSISMDLIRTVGWQILNPNSQELGTSFRVYRLALSEGSFMFQGWTFWESVTRLFASLVPRLFWPTRPAALSDMFSTQLAPPGEGLGFSVAVESYVGGGYLACVLVFIFLGLFSVIVYRAVARKSPSALSVGGYATLFLVAFNINRIDIQTTVKLSLLLAGSTAGCLALLREDSRIRMGRLWRQVLTFSTAQ